MKMAVHLPSELILQILSRLPSRSLLRCRSVCKSWLSLISSTEFRLMHLHNFNQVSPRNVIRFYDREEKKEVYSVCYDDDDQVTPDLPGALIDFPFDYDYTSFNFTMIGCCNGVICLSDYSLDFSGDQIVLWNPSIRKKLTLNLPILGGGEYLLLGFGYDKISDDYKVVRVDINEGSSARSQVEVYTVKTAIWRAVRSITDFPCKLFDRSRVFYNGSVHWMVVDMTPGISRYYIMTFDISTELFGEIPLPWDLMEEFRDIVREDSLAVIGGSLAVIYSNVHTQAESSRYIIWAMKEYKNPASWTMIYDMHYSNEGSCSVLEVRNNGDMIMESEEEEYMTLCVYSSSRKSILADSIFVDRYQESLALLDVGYDDQTLNLERRIEDRYGEERPYPFVGCFVMN